MLLSIPIFLRLYFSPFLIYWCGKKVLRTSPNPKIPTQDWRAGFDSCEGADPPLAVGRVPETFHAVPYCAADALEQRRGLLRRFRDGQGSIGCRKGGLTPMQKAPPKSCSVTQGQGSREWSAMLVELGVLGEGSD